MPIIKSAKKRVRQVNKARTRNRITRQNLRNAVKKFSSAIRGNGNVTEAYAGAQSSLDVAAKKGIIHKNKAARKKKQLAAKAKAHAQATTKKPAAKKKTK